MFFGIKENAGYKEVNFKQLTSTFFLFFIFFIFLKQHSDYVTLFIRRGGH